MITLIVLDVEMRLCDMDSVYGVCALVVQKNVAKIEQIFREPCGPLGGTVYELTGPTGVYEPWICAKEEDVYFFCPLALYVKYQAIGRSVLGMDHNINKESLP